MRHRSPRPIFDLFGRPSSRSVRRVGIAASALALLGTASAVALTVQGDPVDSAHDRTVAKVGAPASQSASTGSDPTPGRAASPSRSDERAGLDGVAPSPLLPREQSAAPSPTAALLTHVPTPTPTEAATTAAAAAASASSTPSSTDAPSPSATRKPLVTAPSQVPTVGSSPTTLRLTKSASRRPAPKSATPSTSSPSSETTAPDTTAPDTTVTTLSTDGGDWTVSVDADEPATFECSLDGAGFEPCASTATFSGLGSGWHTLEARATDAAGNTDASPAQASVKLVGTGSWRSGQQLR